MRQLNLQDAQLDAALAAIDELGLTQDEQRTFLLRLRFRELQGHLAPFSAPERERFALWVVEWAMGQDKENARQQPCATKQEAIG